MYAEQLANVPVVNVLLGSVVGIGAAKAVLGHFSVMVRDIAQLFVAGPPVVSHAMGYDITKEDLGGWHIHCRNGSVDNLAESEEEALSIARRRRARWVLASDLVPRMNDYASYVGRAPSLRSTGGNLAPTERYFRTLQSRLYDFDGAGFRTPALSVPPLDHFRLRFHSQTAIRRGGGWVARWKVFEIVP